MTIKLIGPEAPLNKVSFRGDKKREVRRKECVKYFLAKLGYDETNRILWLIKKPN